MTHPTETLQTAWDYTELADAYLKRPDYSADAVRLITDTARERGNRACDVGAGVAHLTLMLADSGFDVCAVEPNGAMRRNGMERTQEHANVRWFAGTGERTGMPSGAFELVTFGSSFNVCDRERALQEVQRLLTPGGVFACMWNHRVLDDPLQAEIEAVIHAHVDDYDYGSRRQDQTELLEESGLFEFVTPLIGDVQHRQSQADCIEAWRSHATLQRQAGPAFAAVVEEIARVVEAAADANGEIEIPYETRAWMAVLEG